MHELLKFTLLESNWLQRILTHAVFHSLVYTILIKVLICNSMILVSGAQIYLCEAGTLLQFGLWSIN